MSIAALSANDELRHPHDDQFFWRESLYFNFADPRNGLGAWFYLWVVPNKPLKSGMLVSIYKGESGLLTANERAYGSPGHRYVGDNGAWVYCYKREVEALISADFSDVELCGLRLVRTEPLKSYRISFHDGLDAQIDLDVGFMTPPVDYSAGVHPTPQWVAKNRYHRSWIARGEVAIVGERYEIATTGDSDHSWGTRDTEEYARHEFKMWSFQSPDGKNSVSGIDRDSRMFHGFINIAGELESIESISHSSKYKPTGVQRDIDVTFTDRAGRVVHARMPQMFSAIGNGSSTALWGFEGVGVFDVDGWGPCSGLTSYFWPARVSPAQLHGGG
ncbi:hypothetical protein [Phenylobacterium sp.]|uniref:hypothetical protein n=1 Tax=Phenylobacterium sp. TaxID=1871053 RepID=UPI002F41950D